MLGPWTGQHQHEVVRGSFARLWPKGAEPPRIGNFIERSELLPVPGGKKMCKHSVTNSGAVGEIAKVIFFESTVRGGFLTGLIRAAGEALHLEN